jgi:membrane protein involved in colicin uptake
MNNKKGGIGAKILLVLILMLASAAGGAYGYSILDGKLAARDAKKDIEMVRISDYDTEEATTVEGLIDEATKDLETAKTRKDVYEIINNFNGEVAKVKTKAQKELEEAKKEAEEARNSRNNNSNNNGYDSQNNYDDTYGNDYNSNYDSGSNSSGSGTTSNDSSNSTDNSNSGGNAITNDDGTSGRGGLIGSLLNRDN